MPVMLNAYDCCHRVMNIKVLFKYWLITINGKQRSRSSETFAKSSHQMLNLGENEHKPMMW